MRILCAAVLASVLAVAAPAQAQTRIAVIVVDFPTSQAPPLGTTAASVAA